uniref:Uncharacterized protein n=1 Tax=Oryza glumipatula TaxID=40148 RepID=A0A0E0A8N3_9ORYZ
MPAKGFSVYSVLGLSALPKSLKWQTSLAYGSAFSYCLPRVSSEAGFFTLSVPASDTAAAATFSFKPMGYFNDFWTWEIWPLFRQT